MAILRVIGDVHKIHEIYLRTAKQADYSIQVGDLYWQKKKRPYGFLNELNPEFHKVIAGNHDNYATDKEGNFKHHTPHFLGDFGIYNIPGFGDIFFVRGEYSIDHKMRAEGYNVWLYNEQLSQVKGKEAIDLFEKTRPKVIITHGCPSALIWPKARFMGNEWLARNFNIEKHSSTAELLQQMWEVHQPETWIFGHFHKNWQEDIALTSPTDYVDLEGKSHYNVRRAISKKEKIESVFAKAKTEAESPITKFICLGELSHIDFEFEPENKNEEFSFNGRIYEGKK
jgi:hypothetical protein